jgi:hypothetical protein
MKIILSDEENDQYTIKEEVEIKLDVFEFYAVRHSESMMEYGGLKNHYISMSMSGEDLQKFYALLTPSRDVLMIANAFKDFYRHFEDFSEFMFYLRERELFFSFDSNFYDEASIQQMN